MWTSTLKLNIGRVLLTQILGKLWHGAYFASFAPLQVENLPRQPLVSSNWVRVSNRLAGICGNDLRRVFADGDARIAPAALPEYGETYPGHEVVGEVIEVGENVQNLQVGDRVVLQSGSNCLSEGIQPPCRACATGNYSLCGQGRLPGPRPIGGGWSEEMLVHEQQLFRVPAEMEDEQAVLLEPVAVAVRAVLRCPPKVGEKVLVVGAGTIGLLALQVIRALTPDAEVSVLAKHNFQVEQATRMGAAHIIYTRDRYESIKRVTGAKLYAGMLGNQVLLGGYDVIYDTVGSAATIHDSLRWARAGGTVVLVGGSLRQVKVDLSSIWYQEVNLIGSMAHGVEQWPIGTEGQRSTFAIATDLMLNGLIHHEKLITHRFPLSNYREALQIALDKKGSQAIKVIFDARLLPASAVPNVRVAEQEYQSEDVQDTTGDTAVSIPGRKMQSVPGPSHFTMTQSEDFTADFFVTPKFRRPPTPLEFHKTSVDRETDEEPMGPASATNDLSAALEEVEGSVDDSPTSRQS